MTDTDLYILSQINKTLRTDMAQLNALDATLAELITHAKSYREAGTPEDWGKLDALLTKIRADSAKIEEALNLDAAEESHRWENIMENDRRMQEVVVNLKKRGEEVLTGERLQQWRDLWSMIRLQFDSLRAQAVAARARQELCRRYGREKADSMTREVLRHLPASTDVNSATAHAKEYREALDEFEKNKESTGGFFSIFKALFLVRDDTPQEIVARRASRETLA